MKWVNISNPIFDTLDTGKIGHMLLEGINSAIFYNSLINKFFTFSGMLSFIKIGNLFKSLCFSSFFSSSMVSYILFWGAKSILVKITKNGIFKNRQRPICYLVIFWRPMFAPTTTHPKSGESPVKPFIVVLRYFSWPHKSTSDIILELYATTSFQYLFLFWLNLYGTICLPFSSKPMIYWPIELVLPDSCSCK